jgi:signal transduction histidine kinase
MLRGRAHLPVLLYRWLALIIGTVGYLVSSGAVRWTVLVALGSAVLYALVLTVMAAFLHLRRWPWIVTMSLDLAFGALLVVLTGGVESPFLLYYLTPVLQVALWASLQVAIAVTISLGALYPPLALVSDWGNWAALLSPRFLLNEGLILLLAILIIMLIGPALRWREQEGELSRYEQIFSLSGMPRRGVLAVITEETLRAMGTDIALIFTRDPASRQLEVQVPDPYPLATLPRAELARTEWDQAFLEGLLRTDSPALLVDQSFARFPVPEAVRRLFAQQPFLAAPLVLEGEPIGLLLVGRLRSRETFAEGALNHLAELAGRTARVIGWIDSLYSLRRRYTETRAINEVLREINSPHQLENVLQRLVASAREVLQGDRASVMLLDPEGQRLHVRAVAGRPFAGASAEGVPVGQGVSGWVVQHDQPLTVAPENIARFRSQESREVVQALCLPLRTAGQVIGVLNLSRLSPDSRPFMQEDTHLAQILADAAAVAIVKADLLERISAHTRQLSQLNRELASERNKLQWTLASLAEGVLVLNALDQVILLNDVAAQLFGEAGPALMGTDFAEYLHRQGLDDLRGLIQQARAEATPHSAPVVYRGPLQADSEQTLELQITPICVGVEGGTTCEGTVTVMRDVTIQLQQEQARAQFIAKLAQDIRTPLTVIKGYVDLLQGGETGPLTEKQSEFLTRIVHNLQQAVAMVTGLLDLSRIRETHIEIYFEPVDVTAVVREVIELIQPQAVGKRIDLRVTMPPDMAPIIAGRAGLRQVLLNLLDNALKHTSTQGTVLLRVEEENAQLKFAVQDTGIAIPAEMRGRIFQRDVAGEGRGRSSLGLYVAKQIVEAHRGAIWFDSEPGKGTVFSFTLPRDPTQGAVAEGKGV